MPCAHRVGCAVVRHGWQNACASNRVPPDSREHTSRFPPNSAPPYPVAKCDTGQCVPAHMSFHHLVYKTEEDTLHASITTEWVHMGIKEGIL
jgi:hypothetical protein